jgi:hypothetical protein
MTGAAATTSVTGTLTGLFPVFAAASATEP